MSSSLASLFGPPSLPAALETISRDIAAIRDAVQALAKASEAQPVDPEITVRSTSIGSAGPTYWQTAEQMCIIGARLGADAAGRYGITIESDTSDWFRIGANALTDLGYDVGRPLIVPRGLRLMVTPPAGNPNWDLIFWWVPGLSRGRVS